MDHEQLIALRAPGNRLPSGGEGDMASPWIEELGRTGFIWDLQRGGMLPPERRISDFLESNVKLPHLSVRRQDQRAWALSRIWLSRWPDDRDFTIRAYERSASEQLHAVNPDSMTDETFLSPYSEILASFRSRLRRREEVDQVAGRGKLGILAIQVDIFLTWDGDPFNSGLGNFGE